MAPVHRVVRPVPKVVSGIGPGTLKCVISSGKPDALLAALLERISTKNIREFGASAVLVHTEMDASALRDWLSGELGEGESLLVLEFEKWSGYGGKMDREWLLARGH